MKKVGIVTFPVSINYGTMLQAYALRRTCNDFPTIEASIINHASNLKKALEFVLPPTVDINAERLRSVRIERTLEFMKQYNGVTDETSVDPYKDALPYDAYIAGSDTIWNTAYSWLTPVYFLDFVPDHAKKIAYAASIAYSLNITQPREGWFKKYIPRFDAIAVREQSYVEYIQQYANCPVKDVLDPTLLLDATKYEAICDESMVPEENYLLHYQLGQNLAGIEYANLIARKYRLKVLHYSLDIPKGMEIKHSKSFAAAGPKEWLALIKNAKLVLTDSFHATAFSILYQVPFLSYLRIDVSISSRVIELLKIVGLEDRIVYGWRPLNDDLFNVDFTKVDEVIAQKRIESIGFLKKALDIEGE